VRDVAARLSGHQDVLYLLNCVVIALAAVYGLSVSSFVASGSIQGTFTDPSGALVAGAQGTITNRATGPSFSFSTSSAGLDSSGEVAF
jgi:hypothetical protein